MPIFILDARILVIVLFSECIVYDPDFAIVVNIRRIQKCKWD